MLVERFVLTEIKIIIYLKNTLSNSKQNDDVTMTATTTTMKTTMIIILWCCLAETDGRQDVNVAFDRPSFQISTLSTWSSNLANDGNRETNMYVGSCMHTNIETNPWWAVDLLVALYVAGVKFTNREDSSGMYINARQSSSAIVSHLLVVYRTQSVAAISKARKKLVRNTDFE